MFIVFLFFSLGKLSVNIISFDARVLGFSPTDSALLREGGCTDTAFEKLWLKPCAPVADRWEAFRKALSYSVGNKESTGLPWKDDLVPWKEGGLGVCHITLSQLYH